MGAPRYGNFLRVCNSIAHEWDVELNARRKISHLEATMYYFGNHISRIALYWHENSTLSMNENKRIDNPPIKIVKGVSALKIKTCVKSRKKNNGHNFQYTNFSAIELFLTDRRNPSSTRPKSAYGKSSMSRFSFSVTRNAIDPTLLLWIIFSCNKLRYFC